MIQMQHSLFPLDRDWLAGCLRAHGNEHDSGLTPCGDHDLNPGTRASTPLIPAAVLIPLVAHGQQPTVLLTRRTDHLNNHPGQVSFPGGHIEAGDGSPEQTAMRETREETGLQPSHIDVVGRLDDYQTGTGFTITPVVAMVTPPFELSPDAHEVAEIFEVPLAFLLDPANHLRHAREFDGIQQQFFAMQYQQHYIWGATAGMLINLYKALIKP